MNGCIFAPAAELIRMMDVDDQGEDPAVGFFDQATRFGEVLFGRRRVGNAGRKLAGDVDGDDVGALPGHANGMRPGPGHAPPR
jgi:hypothetical protein